MLVLLTTDHFPHSYDVVARPRHEIDGICKGSAVTEDTFDNLNQLLASVDKSLLQS